MKKQLVMVRDNVFINPDAVQSVTLEQDWDVDPTTDEKIKVHVWFFRLSDGKTCKSYGFTSVENAKAWLKRHFDVGEIA
jgi:hypothetical protein